MTVPRQSARKRPTAAQVRGMLLEEVLLRLLHKAGYNVVETPANDSTLKKGAAGLVVRGRGGDHQIDSIADFIFQQPFCNPQRILVEAKCESKPVGIEVARNAVGVLKDVSELWIPGKSTRVRKSRYHYTYALFSSSGYRKTTQRYAYAQDIHLIALGNSAYLKDVVGAINHLAADHQTIDAWWLDKLSLTEVRSKIRKALKNEETGGFGHSNEAAGAKVVQDFINICRSLDYVLLGTINRWLPILLAPRDGIVLESLRDPVTVRIKWDNESWYLDDENDNRLFSFDLPVDLFKMYAKDGTLTARAAIAMKDEEMQEIQAVAVIGDSVKFLRFKLDGPWIQALLKPRSEQSSDRNS